MTLSEPAAPRNWQPPSLQAPAPATLPDPAAVAGQARKEGYADGYAEGLAAGRARSEARVAELEALWSAMAAPFRSQEAVLLRELTGLVAKVATAVVQRELTLDPGALDKVLEEALRVLGAVEGSVDIHLHPTDSALVRELLADTPLRESVQLHEDPQLLRGGCRIATASTYIDASTERRLADLLQVFRDSSELGADSSEST